MGSITLANSFHKIFINFFGLGNIFQLTGNLYITDLLDIILVAAFIYSLFFLFKQTRSFLILIGLSIVTILYVLAKIFNLYLTSLALQYFFGVFVVVFVIVFQQEIRKFFELLGLVGTRQIKVKSITSSSPTIAEIIHSCAIMSHEKIGALIILKGHDNFEPILEGGSSLDGLVSEEILLSIFDPHSEGHDGALIIANNRISKFGTHLPLSNNFKEIGKHGTRHSAGLGISETSDAIAIIVSEEKGSISICKEGKMKLLENTTELEKELDKFVKEKYSTNKTESLVKQLIRKDSGLKAISLLLASILWFFSAYQAGIVKKIYSVPVSFFNLPENTLIESYSPKEVSIATFGRGEVAFSGISLSSFSVGIDASKIANGVNEIPLVQANIKKPLNLVINTLEPTSVLLTAKTYTKTKLPIKVKTYGSPYKNLKIARITVTPDQIEAWVPQNVSMPSEISSEDVDVSGKKDSFVIPIQLMIPNGIKLLKPDTPITNVAITLEKL